MCLIDINSWVRRHNIQNKCLLLNITLFIKKISCFMIFKVCYSIKILNVFKDCTDFFQMQIRFHQILGQSTIKWVLDKKIPRNDKVYWYEENLDAFKAKRRKNCIFLWRVRPSKYSVFVWVKHEPNFSKPYIGWPIFLHNALHYP